MLRGGTTEQPGVRGGITAELRQALAFYVGGSKRASRESSRATTSSRQDSAMQLYRTLGVLSSLKDMQLQLQAAESAH